MLPPSGARRCARHLASGAAVCHHGCGTPRGGAAECTARGVAALAARRLITQDGNSGAGRLFAYMPHITINALLYNQRLLFFKAQHRRYIFPIQNKVLNKNHTHTHTIFLKSDSISSCAQWIMGHVYTMPQEPHHWKRGGEKGPDTVFSVCNLAFGCWVSRRRIHR